MEEGVVSIVKRVWVHPALTPGIAYDVDGEKVSAETLAHEGVMVWGGRGGMGVRRLKAGRPD